MQDEQATSSVATEDIADLSPADLSTWKSTGKFPAVKEPDAAAGKKSAEADAKKTPQDQKVQAQPDGATNVQEEEDPKPTSRAGKRIQQLVAERNDWKRKFEEREKAATPEPVAAKVEEKKEKLRAEPKPSDKNEDGSNKYSSYEDYTADRVEWGVEKALRDRDQKATVAAKDAANLRGSLISGSYDARRTRRCTFYEADSVKPWWFCWWMTP